MPWHAHFTRMSTQPDCAHSPLPPASAFGPSQWRPQRPSPSHCCCTCSRGAHARSEIDAISIDYSHYILLVTAHSISSPAPHHTQFPPGSNNLCPLAAGQQALQASKHFTHMRRRRSLLCTMEPTEEESVSLDCSPM